MLVLVTPGEPADVNLDLAVCRSRTDGHFYDNVVEVVLEGPWGEPSDQCLAGDGLILIGWDPTGPMYPVDVNLDLAVCRSRTDGHFYDNVVEVVLEGPWGEPSDQCLAGDGLILIGWDPTGPMYPVDVNLDLAVCRSRTDGHFYDNDNPN